MSDVPSGASCAGHPDVPATATCPRCGAFVCGACERRTRPEARPMCPACWALRSKQVVPQVRPPETRMASLGLGLGIASVLPICPLWLGGLIVNLIVLFKRDEAFRAVRWKAVTGLLLSIGFVAIWALVFVVFKG